jgi:transcriptional regulator with XRE-family HTH domain
MTAGGSVVVRRQLGAQLRRLRVRAGKSVADVTTAGLGSKAKISRIETGRGTVRFADVQALCWLYGADRATTDALTAMTPGTQQDGWQEGFGRGAVPESFALRVGLDEVASRIRCFEPTYVHGLVQTEDYARAVFRADPRLSPDVVEQRVRFRMERQRRLAARDPAPAVLVVIEESTLLRVAGSPEVMVAQLDHLRSAVTAPVEVRVLPLAAGLVPLYGTFALLDFPDSEDPSVAHVALPFGSRYLDRPADRDEYEFVWTILAARSVPIGDWSPG